MGFVCLGISAIEFLVCRVLVGIDILTHFSEIHTTIEKGSDPIIFTFDD